MFPFLFSAGGEGSRNLGFASLLRTFLLAGVSWMLGIKLGFLAFCSCILSVFGVFVPLALFLFRSRVVFQELRFCVVAEGVIVCNK